MKDEKWSSIGTKDEKWSSIGAKDEKWSSIGTKVEEWSSIRTKDEKWSSSGAVVEYDEWSRSGAKDEEWRMAGVYVGVDVCVCIPELNKWSSLLLYTYFFFGFLSNIYLFPFFISFTFSFFSCFLSLLHTL